MDKVKISKSLADAIEHARAEYSDVDIIECQFDPAPWTAGREALDGVPVDILIRALYIGYEVEETPEDKVRGFYIEQKQSISEDQFRTDVAIRKVLDFLNIKIEGVNHD